MEMLKMCDDGYSYEEIVTRLGCRVGTVGATVAADRKTAPKFFCVDEQRRPASPLIDDGGDVGRLTADATT